MTIEYDKVKCATCGKEIHREKRLVNMCANNFCNKECRQKYRKIKSIIVSLLFLFNAQIALCQRYEPIIIYSPTGEPQTILKGNIIYDNYGVPKINTKTKGSMFIFYKK